MSRHVVIIGAGVVGAMSAIHALRDGHRVTILEPETPGGEQAASYGNAGWLSSHSVIRRPSRGCGRRCRGFCSTRSGRWIYMPHLPGSDSLTR